MKLGPGMAVTAEVKIAVRSSTTFSHRWRDTGRNRYGTDKIPLPRHQRSASSSRGVSARSLIDTHAGAAGNMLPSTWTSRR